jgi:hypothetical protein
MDRVGARHLGYADDLGDAQIGLDRTQPLADAIGLVRFEAVEAELVLLGVDGDGLLAHLVGCAHHADGDLAAVGDQDLLEFGHAADSGSGGGRLGALRCSAREAFGQRHGAVTGETRQRSGRSRRGAHKAPPHSFTPDDGT